MGRCGPSLKETMKSHNPKRQLRYAVLSTAAALAAWRKASWDSLAVALIVIISVAVEKLVFSEKSRKTGDRKCLGNSGKSFVELPDAI